MINIRDFANNKSRHVDDYTYGGGAGMLLQAEPVYQSYLHVVEKYCKRDRPRVIYTTPQGKVFNQDMAKGFSEEEDLIIL